MKPSSPDQSDSTEVLSPELATAVAAAPEHLAEAIQAALTCGPESLSAWVEGQMPPLLVRVRVEVARL